MAAPRRRLVVTVVTCPVTLVIRVRRRVRAAHVSH
jgi:hypothetical protein